MTIDETRDSDPDSCDAASNLPVPNSAPVQDEAVVNHLEKLRHCARAALDQAIDERVAVIRQDKFILYADAKRILGALKDLLSWPLSERPPCYLVTAPSDYGKTALINRLYRDLGGDAATRSGVHDRVKLLLLALPARPTDPRIALAIARELNMPVYSGQPSREIGDIVLRELRKRETRVIVLLEFNNLDALTGQEREVAFDFIKDLTNRGISVVGVGTEISAKLVAEDEEIATRLRPLRLTGFAIDSDFERFLATLETFYPFPKPSNLKDLAPEIHARTRGVIGDVVRLTNDAAVWAARQNRELIDRAAFTQCGFVDRVRTASDK